MMCGLSVQCKATVSCGGAELSIKKTDHRFSGVSNICLQHPSDDHELCLKFDESKAKAITPGGGLQYCL